MARTSHSGASVLGSFNAGIVCAHTMVIPHSHTVIDLTLAELKAWPVKDLKSLQEKLGVRVPALVEKDDLAVQVHQRILHLRRQREQEDQERQRQRRAQQQAQGQQSQTNQPQPPRERERTPQRGQRTSTAGGSSSTTTGFPAGSGSSWFENLIGMGCG